MGEETFAVYELLKQKGEDGLPHHLIQMDIEGEGKKHIVRHFIDVGCLILFLKENNLI